MTLDVYSKQYQDNPYPILRALQARTPFHYREKERNWLVLRHGNVKKLLKDHLRLKSSHPRDDRPEPVATGPLTPIQSLRNESGLFWKLSVPNTDPPEHTRIRRALKRPFNAYFSSSVQGFVESKSRHLETSIETLSDLQRLARSRGVELDVAVLRKAFGQDYRLRRLALIHSRNRRGQVAQGSAD